MTIQKPLHCLHLSALAMRAIMTYLLALDQGTSSTRSIVFDRQGHIVAIAQQALTQHYPQSGWVEHDAQEIWQAQVDTARQVLAQLDGATVSAIGITNQRETTVVWHRATGKPVFPAIVWQDRRTESMCNELQERGLQNLVQDRTGLRLDPYFSGTKLKWILDTVPHAREQAANGELAFGTIDSWLIWNLTGGQRHVTDVSNASRTMLFNIHKNCWDTDLLAALEIDPRLLPTVLPSVAHFGDTQADIFSRPIMIGGVAGDQQSALFGQACFQPGMAKNTYGTGCFMLMHTGSTVQTSQNGLIATRAAQSGPHKEYALEGSVFVGGAVVQWMRDGLNAFEKSSQIEALAQSVPDSGGVMLVPAFTGLGAPYWRPDVRGAIVGLSRASTMAHIARAALESIAYQSAALLLAMSKDAVAAGAAPLRELRVDGGASVNDLLMQFQADLLGIPVVRPAMIETTALGAAYLAGLSCGVYKHREELSALWELDRRFTPQHRPEQARALMEKWERAVRQVCAD
jgi:glycerol kinase